VLGFLQNACLKTVQDDHGLLANVKQPTWFRTVGCKWHDTGLMVTMMVMHLIEHVQCRFTKRLPGYNNYTYNDRLTLLNLPSLELHRLCFDLIRCYKILFGLISIDSADLFEVRQTTVMRGHPINCLNRSAPSMLDRLSLHNKTVWNDLPVNTTNFSPLSCFRNSLNKVDLSNYLVLG